MHEWCVPPASQEFTPKTIICRQGRDRAAKPARALLVSSVLFVLSVFTVKLTLVCGIGSTDELSPKKPNSTDVMVVAMTGLVSPLNVTNSPQLVISSLQRNADISKVPLQESNEYHGGIHDLQYNFRTASMETNANRANIANRHRKVIARMYKRKRRSATARETSTTSAQDILNTTYTAEGALNDTAIPASSYATTVPLGTSNVTPNKQDSQTSSRGSTNKHQTDITDYSRTLSILTRPTYSTIERSRSVTPRPSLSTTIPASSSASALLTEPVKLTHEAPVTSEVMTAEFSSTSANVHDQHRTDTLGTHQTPRGPEDDAVTPDISPPSGTPTSDVFLGKATTVTRSKSNLTSSMQSLPGPPKANAASQVATTDQEHTFTSFADIKTDPFILGLMPVCVGLALLGLMGAGIKRCLLYRRLGREVELAQGSQVLQDDKGYTIENPMPKSRRSYIERQVAKTLNQVNKSVSSSKNSINNNAAKDTKVCMEIATISGGSVGMPSGSLSESAGSLRRTASERIPPSRRHSFLKNCRCYCHCPLCGQRDGLKVKNGSSTTGTATTRL